MLYELRLRLEIAWLRIEIAWLRMQTRCLEWQIRRNIARIQGETDSMGSEMNDCCQECSDTIRAHAKEARTGVCDWCKLQVSDLRPARDYDEGMSGRVYDVCGRCVRKQTEEATQWLREYDDEVDN